MHKTGLLAAVVLCAGAFAPATAQAHCCWRGHAPHAAPAWEALPSEQLNLGVYVIYAPPSGPSVFPYRGPRGYRSARWRHARYGDRREQNIIPSSHPINADAEIIESGNDEITIHLRRRPHQ